MKLFFNRIPEVTTVAFYDDVHVEHTHEATVVVDADGVAWIAKHEFAISHEGVLAEAITWMLADELKVPIPQGAFMRGEDGLTWLSRVVDHVTHWNPRKAVFVSNADSFGRVLALDAIVMNTDRHGGNILLQPDPDELSLKAWIIDNEGAHVGYAGFEQLGLELHEPRKIARGLPLDTLAPAAMTAAQLAADLPSATVREIVLEGCGIVGRPEWVEGHTNGLLRRCRNAVSLTTQYLEAIRRYTL